MRLGIKFGVFGLKDVQWWRGLADFPHLIKYLGRNYEWVFYDSDPTGHLDSILVYAECPTYDPNHGVECDNWQEMFPESISGCQCGSAHSEFKWDHMRYCRLWKPWSQI